MGLPRTLIGIMGFIIFVVFMIGISATDLYPDKSNDIKNAQTIIISEINYSMNTSEESSTSYYPGWVLSIGHIISAMFAYVSMLFASLALFLGLSTTLPQEFYLLFALIASSAIISIVLLLRGVTND